MLRFLYFHSDRGRDDIKLAKQTSAKKYIKQNIESRLILLHFLLSNKVVESRTLCQNVENYLKLLCFNLIAVTCKGF